ncbi:MAG: type II secretion system F family protein [Clostridium sp.]
MNNTFFNKIFSYIMDILSFEINFKKPLNIFKSKRLNINEKQISFIAKNLGQIYRDGIPIKRALTLVEEIVPDKRYKESLQKIGKKISVGKSLSESFGEFPKLYPGLFIGLVFIGENTGKLYEILILIGNYYEKSSRLKKEIKSVCAYPVFILISMIIVIAVFINNIIPSFYGIYNSMGITPSNSCKMVYDFRESFKEDYLVNIVYILCWASIIFLFIKCIIPSDKFRYLLKIQMVRDILEYRMILIFSIITSSGVSILYGLEYCIGSMSPKYLNEKIVEIKESIIKGNTLSEAFKKSGVISNYTLAVIKVREETGSLEEGFKDLSIRIEEKMYGKIRKHLKALGPIMIGIVGIILVIFLLVFVLPLFKQLQSGIRR